MQLKNSNIKRMKMIKEERHPWENQLQRKINRGVWDCIKKQLKEGVGDNVVLNESVWMSKKYIIDSYYYLILYKTFSLAN